MEKIATGMLSSPYVCVYVCVCMCLELPSLDTGSKNMLNLFFFLTGKPRFTQSEGTGSDRHMKVAW